MSTQPNTDLMNRGFPVGTETIYANLGLAPQPQSPRRISSLADRLDATRDHKERKSLYTFTKK